MYNCQRQRNEQWEDVAPQKSRIEIYGAVKDREWKIKALRGRLYSALNNGKNTVTMLRITGSCSACSSG